MHFPAFVSYQFKEASVKFRFVEKFDRIFVEQGFVNVSRKFLSKYLRINKRSIINGIYLGVYFKDFQSLVEGFARSRRWAFRIHVSPILFHALHDAQWQEINTYPSSVEGDGGLARPCIKISMVVRANEIIEDSIQITKHNFMLG